MRFTFAAFAALALVSFPVFAHATPMVQFEITGINIYPYPNQAYGSPLDVTFVLPAMPNVANSSPSGFGVFFDFTVTRNGLDSLSDGAYFFSGSNGGGATVSIAGSDGGGPRYDYGGDQFYSGPETAPVFLPGTYSIYGNGAEKLVITDVGMTAAPEPASLALLGTGALAAFGVVRRRVVG